MSILRLKEVLKQKGVTGKELADKVGVSQPAISDIAKGKSFPRPDLLLQIAETLDVDVRELFNRTKTDKEPKEEVDSIINQLENLKAKL